MPLPSNSKRKLTPKFIAWWKQERAAFGVLSTLRRLMGLIWEFFRESTPARKKQRYGDADYDWEYRVNTTSATVGWRTRLMGCFNSPYQPTDEALFHEMLGKIEADFREFTFIDIGSGKGRVLMMAADYPFRQIVGIELLPELHAIAQDNLTRYRSESQRCFSIATVCGDARKYDFPQDPIALYLFNPLPELGLTTLIDNLMGSIRENPRPLYVIYHNPLLAHVLDNRAVFKRISGTEQYAVYANAN
jgi:SAM-dependent methyltransferase